MADAPAYWISALADQCAEALERNRWVDMQDAVRQAAAARGLDPLLVSKWVAQEWDRLGVKAARGAPAA